MCRVSMCADCIWLPTTRVKREAKREEKKRKAKDKNVKNEMAKIKGIKMVKREKGR